MLIEISCLPIRYIHTYFIEQFLTGIFIMLFTGLQVRIEKYLPEVSKMILRPRANIFLQGPTKTVNNLFIHLFFSKSRMRPLCPAIEKYRQRRHRDDIPKNPLSDQIGKSPEWTEEVCLFQKRQSEQSSLTYCWYLT